MPCPPANLHARPDLGTILQEAKEKFQALNRIYAVLGDPEK